MSIVIPLRRTVTVKRDERDGIDLDHQAANANTSLGNPIALRPPLRALPSSVTDRLLDSALPVPAGSTGEGSGMPPMVGALGSESWGLSELSALVTVLVDALEPFRDHASLAYLTLTAPPGRSIAPLVAFVEAEVIGSWLIVDRCHTGMEHVHGLVLMPTLDDVRKLVREYTEKHGLSRDGQKVKPVRGWRSKNHEYLRGNVYDISRYALALGPRFTKRTRELPVEVLTTGALASVDSASRFALVSPTTVMQSERAYGEPLWCECGCGAHVRHGRRYIDERHAARQRQRRKRAADWVRKTYDGEFLSPAEEAVFVERRLHSKSTARVQGTGRS